MRGGGAALEVATRAESFLPSVQHAERRAAPRAHRTIVGRRGRFPGDLVAEANPPRNGSLAFLVDHAFGAAHAQCQAALK
jgi:hypothetical protein